MQSRRNWLIFLLLGALFLVRGAPAQDKSETRDELPTFRANVNVVNLFFNVKDRHGALIPDLKKEDFTVVEDGKPQPIKYFAAEANQPLTLGILIDTSPSQTRVLPLEQEAGASFLREVLQAKDLAFVISFDLNIDLLHDFTNSAGDLKAALNRAQISNGGHVGSMPGMGGGPFPTAQQACCTYLYDAVYLAGHDMLAKEVGRKAMVILTDGEDEGSKLKVADAIEAAQKSDSIVYVILIADRGFYSSQGYGYSGDRAMRKLAEETGGRVIDVGNKEDKLKEAFAQISKELRSQYNIGYTPTNAKLDGTFRRIGIHTDNANYRIQARMGYYAVKSPGGN